MGLIQLHWLFWAVLGIYGGASLGHHYWGTPGLIIGIPLGLVAGYVMLQLTCLILAIIFKMLWGGTIFSPKGKESISSSNNEINP